MKLKKLAKQATKTLLALFVIGGEILGYLAPSQFASAFISASTHGIDLTTINKDKVLVEPYSIISISGDLQGIRLGAVQADIRVNDALAGNALGFVDSNSQADRGWYYVDETEARDWVTQFGGNPDYVFTSSRSNVYRSDVSDYNNLGAFATYKAYNLAELAVASGGHGDINGDNLVQKSTNVNDYWKSVGNFYTTPRPTATVRTENPTYKVNETVNIIASATDYSYYVQGIQIENLSVFNTTTGSGYQQLVSNREIRPTPQAGVKYTWNGSGATDPELKFVPTTPGTYKVYLYVRDLHGRAAQNSSDVRNTVAYEYTFQVDPAPAQANLLVDESSITFTPSNPTKWSDVQKVEFDVVNQSQQTYSPPLAFKFATSSDPSAPAVTATLTPTPSLSSGKATNLAGGERRHYSVSVSGLSSSETTLYFVANINYDKTTPPDETNWTDNRGVAAISLSSGTGDGGCPVDKANKTKMDIRIEGGSDTEMSDVSSGSPDIYLSSKADRIVFTADKDGTFTLNGTTTLPAGSGGNLKVGIIDFLPKNTFTVSYESLDGTLCWTKTFIRDSGNDEEDSCPIVILTRTLDYGSVPVGETVEVVKGEQITFKAETWSTEGSTTTKKPTEVTWKVKRPDGSVVTLPVTESEKNNNWVSYASSSLTLPTPSYYPGSYQVKFDQPDSNFELSYVYTTPKGKVCNWSIKIHVKAGNCIIDEAMALTVTLYGEPPSGYSPSGQLLNSQYAYLEDVYMGTFTKLSDGRYDTHMDLTASYPGTWYIEDMSTKQREAITSSMASNQKADVILPAYVDTNDEIRLVFVSSSPSGCEYQIEFIIQASKNKSCPLISIATAKGKQTIGVGDIVTLSSNDFYSSTWFGKKQRHLYALEEEFTRARLYKLNEQSQEYEFIENGNSGYIWLTGGYSYWNDPYQDEYLFRNFPLNADGTVEEGMYKIDWYDETGNLDDCEGFFFLKVTNSPAGQENLLVDPDSFTITPNQPQKSGTDATIRFVVKNEGKLTHSPRLAVRWQNASVIYVDDQVKDFLPGTSRTITVVTKYPSSSQNFIAHINDDKKNPTVETNWEDNRAEWPVAVTDDSGSGGGGGTDPQGCNIATSPAIATAVVNGQTVNMPSGGTYTMPSGATQIKLTFAETGTLTVNGVSKGSAKSFTITITGPTNLQFEAASPNATNCWGKTIVLAAAQECSIVFMHIYDSAKGDFTYNVANGSTYSIAAAKVDQIGVVLTPTDDSWGNEIEATYTGTLPNQAPPELQKVGYVRNDVLPGTYKVNAVVSDSRYPETVGCSYEVTFKITANTIPDEPDIPPGDTGGGYDAGDSVIKLPQSLRFFS